MCCVRSAACQCGPGVLPPLPPPAHRFSLRVLRRDQGRGGEGALGAPVQRCLRRLLLSGCPVPEDGGGVRSPGGARGIWAVGRVRGEWRRGLRTHVTCAGSCPPRPGRCLVLTPDSYV